MKTIFPSISATTDPAAVAVKLIRQRVFDDVLDNKAHAIAIYEKNITDVQAAFGEDRLLTYSIGDGWAPLCRFLEKPIPDVPFPRLNSSDEFNSRQSK